MRDLYHFDFIYLQKEILKVDLSKYFFCKNLKILFASSKLEYKAFLNYYNAYSKKIIVITELPRYDYLREQQKYIKPKKLILLMPEGRYILKDSESFKKSIYFSFYNNLINNKILHNFMKNNNYKGLFCLRENFINQKTFFKKNKVFKIITECNIDKLLIKSSILITDYSSTSFDFGYIQKPVIYTHFANQEYKNFQLKGRYFNYKSDGFGPICHNIICTVKNIISTIENKCKLKKIYLRRIKKFFFFFDEKNSKRIYKEIIKDKSNTKRKSSNILFIIIIILIFIKMILILIYKR